MNTSLYLQRFKVALVGLLSLTIWGCTTTTETPPFVAVGEPTHSSQTKHAGGNTVQPSNDSLPVVRVWLDCSTSMHQAVFEKNLEGIMTSIRNHARLASGVEVICFARGSTSIWDERPDRFIWGTPPADPAPFVPSFDKAQPKDRMFKDSHDKLIAVQKAEYDKAISDALVAYDTNVITQLKSLRERLLRVPQIAAPCTHFSELANRVQRENLALNLIISDGYADCEDKALETLPHVSIAGRIVFVQVPANGNDSSSGSVLRERETFVNGLMPKAHSVPIYMPERAISILFE